MRIKNTTKITLLMGLCISCWACQSGTETATEGKPLAKVGEHQLYPADVAGIGAGMPPKDSLYQLQLHTEQWVRNQLMLEVAKNNIDVGEKIERMVQDYEATLIMNAYEEAFIKQRLTSEVTPQEIANYYNQNKEQYQSGISWVRCHFVKVSRKNPEVRQLKKWFKSDEGADFERIKLFCAKNKTTHILNEDLWIEYDKIIDALPPNSLTKRHREKQTVLDRSDEDYQYLLQIFEYRDKEEAAPLVQVKDEIQRILLHQRRNQILQDLRKEVYEKAKKEGRFEIY